jgi:hypothetical protein
MEGEIETGYMPISHCQPDSPPREDTYTVASTESELWNLASPSLLYCSKGNGMHDDAAEFSHKPLRILNGIRVGMLGQNVVSWVRRLILTTPRSAVVDFHNELR